MSKKQRTIAEVFGGIHMKPKKLDKSVLKLWYIRAGFRFLQLRLL